MKIETDGPLTSGELIDALKSGRMLEREYSTPECIQYLKYEEGYLRTYGWASANGTASDRILDILFHPEYWRFSKE